MDNLIFVDVSSKDESLSAFSNLLPEGYEEGWNRVLIGCCNESGQALGIVEFQESFEECEILWIYVDPTVRNQRIGHKVPSFVSEANSLSEILQFYCDIKKEYEKSKDLLHYLNQYMIGKKLPNDNNSLPLAIREMLGKDQMDILLEKINNLLKGTIFPEDSEIIYSKPPRYSDYGINKTYLNGKWYISYPVMYRDWINKLI